MMNIQNTLPSSGAWEARLRIRIPVLANVSDAIFGVWDVATDVWEHLLAVRYNVHQTAYHTFFDDIPCDDSHDSGRCFVDCFITYEKVPH